MSDNSPLFMSSMELYAHAVELASTGKSRDCRLTVLHLANAVELLLKDTILNSGHSIYKNPKETLTIWACFQELDGLGVVVPEKQYLELLIDDRNVIQHRFGSPDACTGAWRSHIPGHADHVFRGMAITYSGPWRPVSGPARKT